MPVQPIVQNWESPAAVLLVHGIGNDTSDDLIPIENELRQVISNDNGSLSCYRFSYEFINDWITEKTQVKKVVAKLKNSISEKLGSTETTNIVTDYLADVIWPLLSSDIRRAIRKALIQQLQQIVKDGIDSGFPKDTQKITIMAHSLGCFYTYEALHYCATHPDEQLQPATHGVRLENVILMASPVQLIRTVASTIKPIIPEPDDLAALALPELAFPFEKTFYGTVTPLVKNWYTITGDLDPIGGHLMRRKLDWAYTAIPPNDGLPPATEVIERQDWCSINTMDELVEQLKEAITGDEFPKISINNPHSWMRYIEHHKQELEQWFV